MEWLLKKFSFYRMAVLRNIKDQINQSDKYIGVATKVEMGIDLQEYGYIKTTEEYLYFIGE